MAKRSHWRKVPISRTYIGLYDGPHATPKPSDDGPVFLGIGNITEDGHLDLDNVRHIAEEEFPRWTKRVEPTPGDIVFTYEATLNRYAIIPPGFRGCLGRRLALIRPNPQVVDTKFLYYSFFGPVWRATIAANTLSGATVDRIPLSRFPEFPIDLPQLSEQRRIASILSAYDDLIENNTRRIAILEEMARRMYEDWFVRFRFPGHGQHQYSDDNLPPGWMRSKLADLCKKIGSGATPLGGKSSYKEEGIALIRSQNVYDYKFVDDGLAFLDSEQAAALEAVTVEPEDVLINITGASVGRCCIAPRRHLPARVNQHVMILRADAARITAHYLLLTINSPAKKQQLLTYAQTGATREALTKDRLSQFEIILPDQKTLALFEQLAGNALDLCEIIAEQTAKLRACRDLLLPKLISGEIDICSLPDPEAAVA